MHRITVIAIFFTLMLFTVPNVAGQDIQHILETWQKGDVFVPMFPAARMYHDGECAFCAGFGSQTGPIPIYGLDVYPTSTFPGLPIVAEYGFEKFDQKDDYLEAEFRSTAEVLKLRFYEGSGDRILSLMVPGRLDDAEVQDRFSDVYKDVASALFVDELTAVPEDFQIGLLAYVHQDLRQFSVTGIGHTRFRGGRYLRVPLDLARFARTPGFVLNTVRFDRPQQRVAFLLNEQGLLDVLKEVGSVFEGTSLTGLHLQTDVQHRNLVTEDPIRSDSLDIYVDAAVAQDLLDFDITTQKFVDDSVIVVDGNRIQVDLGGN